MAKIVVSFPPGSDTVHELTEETVTIGRTADNGIQIEDASVSSSHAEIVPQGDGNYLLRDLGSTNGTRVDGAGISEANLGDGSRIMFGKIDATFVSEVGGAAQPLPEESRIEARPAASSVKPSNFANASPFSSKGRKKDPAGAAVLGFAAVSVLAFVAAVALILGLKP